MRKGLCGKSEIRNRTSEIRNAQGLRAGDYLREAFMQHKYLPQLDGFRLIAVLLVMYGHWVQWQYPPGDLPALPAAYGVHLFFVLSGFLITRILLRAREESEQLGGKRGRSLVAFYIRRSLRIFPVYYLTVLILQLVDFPKSDELAPWLYSYTLNYYAVFNPGADLGSFIHFWSLCVEEHFYLVWPLIVLFAPLRRLPAIILTLCFCSMALRGFILYKYELWDIAQRETFCNLFPLAFGALLGWWSLYRRELSERLASRWWLPWAALLAFILLNRTAWYFQWGFYICLFDLPVFVLVCFFFVARAQERKFAGPMRLFLENGLVQYLGKITYGLYIFHMFAANLYMMIFPTVLGGKSCENMWTCAGWLLLITIGVATISWHLFEAPLNRLKERLPYVRTRKKSS